MHAASQKYKVISESQEKERCGEQRNKIEGGCAQETVSEYPNNYSSQVIRLTEMRGATVAPNQVGSESLPTVSTNLERDIPGVREVEDFTSGGSKGFACQKFFVSFC